MKSHYQIHPGENVVAMDHKVVQSDMAAPVRADDKEAREVCHELGNVSLNCNP